MCVAVLGFGLALVCGCFAVYWRCEIVRETPPADRRRFMRKAAWSFLFCLLALIVGAVGYVAYLLERIQPHL
jgi:hypothetical protein